MIEIDRTRQLLYAVLDGEVQWVFHTSTGTEQPYPHPEGFTARHAHRLLPGGRVAGGRTWADVPAHYFHHDGIALHGYHAIPPHPASHGCARVTFDAIFDAIDFIWANDLIPMGSTVLVYGETRLRARPCDRSAR